MFLAHRRELVNQCSKKLTNFGVDHGILMSGEFPYGATDVQVASIDTLRARCLNTDKLPMPRADVLIIDEAHRSLAATYIKVIRAYPQAVVLGLTATPIRSDGKGLGHIYEDMVQCPSISQLIALGHLVRPRTCAPTIPDLTGVPIKKGDYDAAALDAAMNKRRLVGDIITHWARFAIDRPTIVFASGVKHSIHLADEFRKIGVAAAHIDGNTTVVERKQIISDLEEGKIQVICNYAVLTEGFDQPKLSACILARPTKNMGLYLQMAGRTLRPASNKKDSLIIDHSGNVYEHGFVQDDHDWILEVGRALESTPKERQEKFDEAKPITCVNCTEVYTGQLACPSCGHVPKRKGKHVESLSGELMELREDKRRSAKKRKYTMEEKSEFYWMLLQYADTHGKSKGWAAHTYRRKFEVWPNQISDEGRVDPSMEVLAYIRSRNIAYAKWMEKKNAAAN